MSTPTSSPGRTIGGRYALRSAVGAGGMGTVWRAYDELLRREVAVKEVLLPPGVPAEERQMLCERTLREARAAASLNVPSVVTIYDVVEEDNRPWIVMQLLPARSLAEIVRDDGPLPVPTVADIGLQVLTALEAAHAAGILHRDVKPGNVLLADDGRATLTDFGVARTAGDSALTSTGLLLGSPCYISPERARGREPGPTSDLWALGATLYAAVEGQPPFDKGDPMQTLTAIVSDPPAPMRLAGPLAPALSGLLEKDTERRLTVQQARAAFRRASEAGSSDPMRSGVPAGGAAARVDPARTQILPSKSPPRAQWPPPSPPSPPRRRIGGRRAALAGLLVLVLVAAAVAAYLYLPRPSARAPHASPAKPAAQSVPAGFVRYTHRKGFSVAVPKGWAIEVSPSGTVQFRDPAGGPDGGRFLRLSVTPAGGHDMRALWQAADAYNKSRLPGYQLVGITPTEVPGHDGAADWEFTHTQQGNRHVVDRGFIAGETAYGFYLSTGESQFAESRSIVGVVAESFQLS